MNVCLILHLDTHAGTVEELRESPDIHNNIMLQCGGGGYIVTVCLVQDE